MMTIFCLWLWASFLPNDPGFHRFDDSAAWTLTSLILTFSCGLQASSRAFAGLSLDQMRLLHGEGRPAHSHSGIPNVFPKGDVKPHSGFIILALTIHPYN